MYPTLRVIILNISEINKLKGRGQHTRLKNIFQLYATDNRYTLDSKIKQVESKRMERYTM